MPRMRIALASSTAVPAQFKDDQMVADALADRDVLVEIIPWDRPRARWDGFDLVVVRSVWDYAFHHEEFVDWAEGLDTPMHNPADMIRWNSDKRYLADLGRAGIRVVETEYVPPGIEPTAIDREVVVKPTVSGGARDTGRFAAEESDAAYALIATIHEKKKTAMVQPYNASVDAIGETAVVMIDGAFSHALRKGVVLNPNEVAPVRDDDLAAAEAMYDPDLVGPGAASQAELEAAAEIVAAVEERFGVRPLYARVDLLMGEDGAPELIELEAIEPNLYHELVPGSAERFADAIVRRAEASS